MTAPKVSTRITTVSTFQPVSELGVSDQFPFVPANAAITYNPHDVKATPAAMTTVTTQTATMHLTLKDPSIPCTCDAAVAYCTAAAACALLPGVNDHQIIFMPIPAGCDLQNPIAAPSICSAHDGRPQVSSVGETQVDTFVASTGSIQTTTYSWKRNIEFLTMFCTDLPVTGQNKVDSNNASISITDGCGRLCHHDKISSCPGHPWINHNYSLDVTQSQRSIATSVLSSLQQLQLFQAAQLPSSSSTSSNVQANCHATASSAFMQPKLGFFQHAREPAVHNSFESVIDSSVCQTDDDEESDFDSVVDDESSGDELDLIMEYDATSRDDAETSDS